jgi:hypothetical protein
VARSGVCPIGNFCSIGNIRLIGNVFPIGDICLIASAAPRHDGGADYIAPRA